MIHPLSRATPRSDRWSLFTLPHLALVFKMSVVVEKMKRTVDANTQTMNKQDCEIRRQAALEAAQEDVTSAEFAQRFGPDSLGAHEVTDRAFLVNELWGFVHEHPACLANPDLFRLADEIADKLGEFYQQAARSEVGERVTSRKPFQEKRCAAS
jgi:hypothetical protein